MKPVFFITIDTEPDNQWEQDDFTKTQNAQFIPRFQTLCESYGFKPVYLTEYNMAKNDFFIQYMNKKLQEHACEIGVHPHAWSTPPFVEITENDAHNKPFLIDYDYETMYLKMKTLMDLLRSRFNTKLLTHRAGRWAFDTRYINLLAEFGLKYDCSIYPLTKIPPSSQYTNLSPDYRTVTNRIYEMAADNIVIPGNSGIIEIPFTIRKNENKITEKIINRFPHIPSRIKKWIAPNWMLRPNGSNLVYMQRLCNYAVRNKMPYIEFMLHSSELMPGSSPTFKTEADVEKLYSDLTALFKKIACHFSGMTIQEYFENRETAL